MSHAILWLNEIEKDDASLVGRKGSELGELVQAGFPLADGFVISSYVYFRFLRENNITTKINRLLGTVDFARQDSLMQVSGNIQRLIKQESLSEDLLHDIFHAYRRLSGTITDLPVVLTPSEDTKRIFSPTKISHHEKVPHVQGETDLILQLKEIWASLFDPAILLQHREQHHDLFRSGLAVVVQKQIVPEVTGTMTTINPATNEKNCLVIEALFGMPQASSPDSTPDYYEVDKHDLHIVQKQIANQEKKLVDSHEKNKLVTLESGELRRQKLTDNQILELAAYGKRLERHLYFPQEIDWVLVKQSFIFTKIRPLIPSQVKQANEKQREPQSLPLLLKGIPASPGIVTGIVKYVFTPKDAEKIARTHIVVTSQTDALPSHLLKKAAGIVTDTGGASSQAALFAQKHGIPAVVGTEKATTILKENTVITINGSKGEVSKGSFASSPAFPVITDKPRKTATKVTVTITNPSLVEKASLEPVEGVGLLQADSLLTRIGMHPKELVNRNKQVLFIDELTNILATTCFAFQQRPVIYQAIDLLSSSYRELKGGKAYEPSEPDPLLGFHGASRALHTPQLFLLEIEAIKKVRNEKKLKNLSLMLPFVRTAQEVTALRRVLSDNGLHRSPTFGLWLKVQTPANCISLESFIKAGIDGVMLDIDDLTMFILGVDKENSEVAHTFDEQNPAVLWALERVIKTAQANHIPSSITGKSLAHQLELLEHAITCGITTISVPAAHVRSVRTVIADTEEKLLR